ncbi:hypothetical protein [Paenibacillus sp. SI8]|uniref:hypothetical protein n=1 Tax=unclassified Paenibacillus TaxID=185978 RepID=UPI003467AEE6
MIKQLFILFSICLVFVGVVGCGGNPAAGASKVANASPHDQHTQQPAKAGQAAKYSLDATVSKENDSYILKVTTNLKLSSEHYEGAPVDGEGHIHFYLNGTLVGPIKDTAPYPLQGLQKGTNKIKLALAENNHTEIGVFKELSVEKAD